LRYFIEDANEQGNTIRKNLGVSAMPHTLLKPADASAASFWITSPNNMYSYLFDFHGNRFVALIASFHSFEGNVAAGSTFGFWFAMPKQPTGFGPSFADFSITYPRFGDLGALFVSSPMRRYPLSSLISLS